MRGLLLAALMAACALGPAAAQHPVSPELEKFMLTPEQGKAVVANYRRHWHDLFPACPKPTLKTADTIVYVPPKFDSAGQPVSGLWQIAAHVEGCGQARILSTFYWAEDGHWKRIVTLPGSTIADPHLQMDSLDFAAMAMVKIAANDCDDYKYVDTAFEAYGTGTGGAHPPWTEKWTIQACGVEGVVRMHFTPDAHGTQITASPDETVRLR